MSGFKLPGFGGKKTNIKRDMDRKYGHGDFASKEKRMRPGESKFNYDVRMRKQERGATTTPTTKPGSTYQAQILTQYYRLLVQPRHHIEIQHKKVVQVI